MNMDSLRIFLVKVEYQHLEIWLHIWRIKQWLNKLNYILLSFKILKLYFFPLILKFICPYLEDKYIIYLVYLTKVINMHFLSFKFYFFFSPTFSFYHTTLIRSIHLLFSHSMFFFLHISSISSNSICLI